MTAIIALITALVGALAPLLPKLLTGEMSVADAKAAADAAVAQYAADSANLAALEAADDKTADDAAKAP